MAALAGTALPAPSNRCSTVSTTRSSSAVSELRDSVNTALAGPPLISVTLATAVEPGAPSSVTDTFAVPGAALPGCQATRKTPGATPTGSPPKAPTLAFALSLAENSGSPFLSTTKASSRPREPPSAATGSSSANSATRLKAGTPRSMVFCDSLPTSSTERATARSGPGGTTSGTLARPVLSACTGPWLSLPIITVTVLFGLVRTAVSPLPHRCSGTKPTADEVAVSMVAATMATWGNASLGGVKVTVQTPAPVRVGADSAPVETVSIGGATSSGVPSRFFAVSVTVAAGVSPSTRRAGGERERTAQQKMQGPTGHRHRPILRRDGLAREDCGAVHVRRATTPDELAACLRIRRVVFIEEQGVSEADELDTLDEVCRHFLATPTATSPPADALGTARLLFLDADSAKAQRVAVLAEQRGKGVGAALMFALEGEAARAGCTSMVLASQASAVSFYQRLGYQPYGEVFVDAGIDHLMMKKPIS